MNLDLGRQHKLEILDNKFGNKRWQTVCGLQRVETPYVVFCDDHVFWPTGSRFLHSALAPFEDLDIAGVGTNKPVVREKHSFFNPKFSNFFDCIYLDRHNVETVCTNRIGGSLWVISGRACIYRTDIVKSPAFVDVYLNEYIFFGYVGPLNADNDLFISSWMATKGHKLFFQIGENALMHTTIDVPWSGYSGEATSPVSRSLG